MENLRDTIDSLSQEREEYRKKLELHSTYAAARERFTLIVEFTSFALSELELTPEQINLLMTFAGKVADEGKVMVQMAEGAVQGVQNVH